MKDLNYFPLEVESNIYSLANLQFDCGTSKVLVATLDCKIFCICYKNLKAHTREVEFTYIPNGAKINSIGALKRGPNDFVIGITHFLAPSSQKSTSRQSSGFISRDVGDYGRSNTYYLNIYASGPVASNFDLDYLAQGCQTLRLRYVPYHLYSAEHITVIDSTARKKPFWLLSGGDNAIHAFCEDRPYQSFTEIPIEDCFPELSKLPGLALWIDMLNLENEDNNYSRVIALGLEDGSVKLYHSVLSRTSNRYMLVKESSFDEFTTIIPCIRLFRTKSTKQSKLRSSLKDRGLLKETSNKSLEQLNLLVVSSTNPCMIFKDVINSGLDDRIELPESQRLDCVVSATIGDLNFDGLNELILGTHGRELLTYKYDFTRDSYYLSHVSELNYPIYAMSILDLTGDGLNDLIILLASGILIMQAEVKDVIEVCRRRVDAIYSLLDQAVHDT